MTEMRASLIVTADARAVVVENRAAADSLRGLRQEAEATASGMARAATELDRQSQVAQRLDRVFDSFGQNRRSAGSSAEVFEGARELAAFQQEQATRAARAYQSIEESLNPLVRAQREFEAAQGAVRQAVETGSATNEAAARTLQQLEARYQTFVRAQNPAVQSARAFEQAIEEDERAVRQLMLALDPTARATAELAQQEALLTRAVRQGIVTKEEAARASVQLAEAQGRVVGGAGRMGGSIQNVSFQLTDFIVQVQSGQSATMAFAQQAPQLLGGFGALGAVLGLTAALATPLIAMLFKSGDAAGNLDERLGKLDQTLQSVDERLSVLRDKNLDETFGSFTGEVRTLTGMLLELDRAAELKNLRDTLDKTLRENIDPTLGQSAWAGFKAGFSAPIMSGDRSRAIQQRLTEENYADLTQGRGLSLGEFTERRGELNSLAETGDIEAVARRVQDLFRDMKGDAPFASMKSDLQDMLVTLGVVVTDTARLEASLNGSAEAARLTGDAEERLRIDQQQLAVAEAIAAYGDDSRQAEATRAEVARQNYELELEREGHTGAALDNLMASYDSTVAAQDAASDWADRMGDVRSQVEGILSAITSLGGEAVERAAQRAEITALNAGATVDEARRRGQASRREAEFNARSQGAGFSGRIAASAQYAWDAGGDALDDELNDARGTARDREREANKKPPKGQSERSSLSSVSEIKRELARLQPSYEADLAAANAWRDKALASLDKAKGGYAEFADDVQTIYDERLKKAYEDDLKRRDDWAAGIERGLISAEDNLTTWADTAEELVTGWGKAGEDAFVNFSKTGKAEIGDLVEFALEQFARMAFQQTVQPGMNQAMGWLTQGLGSWLGGSLGSSAPTTSIRPVGRPASLSTNHTGSPGVMRSYALAGHGDTMRGDERLTMTRRGEEIMTSRALENAGALISSLSSLASQSSGTATIDARPIIQVQNNSSAQVQAEITETTDAKGQKQYALALSDAVSTGLKAPGGAARKTMQSEYNLRRPGIHR